MKKYMLITMLCGLAFISNVFASNDSESLSAPGYYGNINNNTGYVIECSQMNGGYCANNPMPGNGYIQMLPDSGSKEITGHIMVFTESKPSMYIDNIIFKYSKTKKDNWYFSIRSLYNKIEIKIIDQGTILLQKASK